VNLIIKKYGGATLSTPEKIKAVAQHLADRHKAGEDLVVVVSAMGKTTNTLIELAQQVSQHPLRRELDMLLSTGERVSMALMSMALNDLGCPAISFTGSQAGILTNESHSNALITDVKAARIMESINKGQVVILAGFQGVSPHTKEITTLGRGGSDTSAVAIAAALNATRCEILKDVPAIFSADPSVIKGARPIHNVNYQQLIEMTFWGAKVLHYRSVELGMIRQVPLYIGPAHSLLEGTQVFLTTETQTGENTMFESNHLLSLNFHTTVLCLEHSSRRVSEVLLNLKTLLDEKEIYWPQILNLDSNNKGTKIYLTGPDEVIQSILKMVWTQTSFHLDPNHLSSISGTCTGNSTSQMAQNFILKLDKQNITYEKVQLSGMTVSIFLPQSLRETALKYLHTFAENQQPKPK
jgi:aspartate kinase